MKRKQNGVIPFYNYPDNHGDDLVKSLELTLPIGFSSPTFFLIKALGENSMVQIALNGEKLAILDFDSEKAINIELDHFKVLKDHNFYQIETSNIPEFSKSLDKFLRSVCGIKNLPNCNHYNFEMYWMTEEDQNKVEGKWNTAK